uniref:Uncharacterized protein n=1 Tax=Tanacetum cinerariifolium TaxID=118510 RepID=A0A699KIJ2_TANCI|nr:hypothetical protein [Tanacetum cinerariifolium]
MLEFEAYKTYYAFASGEKTPKPKYVLKKVDSDTSPKQKPIQATKESWGDSDEEDDDEDDFEDDVDNNDDDSDDNDKSDNKRTESDRDEIPDPNLTNVDQNKYEEEEVNERVHILSDYELTDDEKIHDEENIDEEEKDESGFEKEEEDAYVTLTHVLDAQKTGEIKQVNQYAQALSFIPTIVDRYMDNKLGEVINKAIQVHNFDCREEDQAKNNVATPAIEKNVIDSLETVVLTRSSSQPQSSYEAAATLSEFELAKILIDKMKKNKSRELYDELIKSYNTDKDIFKSYDQGTKRRKSSKDAESSRDSKSKENKSSSTSKDASQSRHKSSSKSAHAEEPSHTVEDSSMQQDQEFVTGDNDEQPTDKEVTKAD